MSLYPYEPQFFHPYNGEKNTGLYALKGCLRVERESAEGSYCCYPHLSHPESIMQISVGRSIPFLGFNHELFLEPATDTFELKVFPPTPHFFPANY